MEKQSKDDSGLIKIFFYIQIALIVILTVIHEGGIRYVHLGDLFFWFLIYTLYFTIAFVGLLIIALLPFKISHEDRGFTVIIIISTVFADIMTSLFCFGVISFFGNWLRI